MPPTAQAAGEWLSQSPERANARRCAQETAKRYQPSAQQGRGRYDSAAQAKVREL